MTKVRRMIKLYYSLAMSVPLKQCSTGI